MISIQSNFRNTVFTRMDTVASIISVLERCGIYSRVDTIQGMRTHTFILIVHIQKHGKPRQADEDFCFTSIVHRHHVYNGETYFWGSPRTTMTGMLCVCVRVK